MREAGGWTIIILLSAALALALGILFYGVGRIVLGLAHYYFCERKARREFKHPQLGMFTSQNQLWSGELTVQGKKVPVLIDGTESAPSEGLFVQLQSLLGRLGELEKRAADFLRSREEEVRDATLELYSFDIVDEKRPQDFTFEFIVPGDEILVWRVEFVDGEPRATGFDD